MQIQLKILICGILLALIFCQTPEAAEIRIESQGKIGAGIFFPTGQDGDVARTSPAFQLTAGFGLRKHLGLETEFLYTSVLIEDTELSNYAHRKSTQFALMGGLKIASDLLLDSQSSGIGYLSLRAGFARISVRADSERPQGGWIGRPIDEIENPVFIPSTATIIRQKGLVLSPKVGFLFRMSDKTALDLAASTLFIFDRGDVSTQIYLTLSLARAAWQNF
ncbi:MAG: hypothetical protein O7G87_23070 [bacterium]|nr:hypothetical protein [bacterium]